jgi:hypothetical protein
MAPDLRPNRVVSSLLALTAVLALSIVSVAPAQAATNATLGDLSAATPAANKYAGCVASVLTGAGVTFGSSAALGASLAAIWSTLPGSIADTCKLAVDGNQPQVCVNPAGPATCPAIGAATATALADQPVSLPGNWKLLTDGIGTGGYAQTPLATSGPSAPMATVSGTFTNPAYNCTTPDCGTLPPVGLFTDCGPTTCGAVTNMTVSFVGRTPNGENGVQGHAHAVDGFGNVIDVAGIYGLPYQGTGCGSAECVFSSRLQWPCKDGLNGLPANCGGQTLSVAFTFDSGNGGGCACATPPPPLGQQVEVQLDAANLNLHQNPVCAGNVDCMRYDDMRLSYLDGSGQPTAVEYPGVPGPSAVIDLASSNLACLVGVNVARGAAVSCLDVTGASAPLLQAAHAPIVPTGPPAISASASPAAGPSGWSAVPVTVTLTATDDKGPGVKSITYSAGGAQATPATTLFASTAAVVVSADGSTTLSFFTTDTAGVSSAPQSITVQVDQTAPTVACATPSTGWSATDVAISCTATDAASGLANPGQALLTLSTSVPGGTETASATTGSATVCDVAGNCATVGPITALKVDRLPPSITITAPGGTYTTGQLVIAAYSCTDGGSGVATCVGPQPSGSLVNTLLVGTHSFVVDATDAVGNHSQAVATYTVTAPTCQGDDEGDQESDAEGDHHHRYGEIAVTCDSSGFQGR